MTYTFGGWGAGMGTREREKEFCDTLNFLVLEAQSSMQMLHPTQEYLPVSEAGQELLPKSFSCTADLK